jgi:folate-dependent phosphoribosylglycinamide formyltransferase PurN
MNIGFLASHNGTNMQAIIDACKTGSLEASPVVVISNNSRSGALARAKQESIPRSHLSTKTHPDPDKLDLAILDTMLAHNVEDLYSNYVPMAICTSKRSDYAEKILHMFEIRHMFFFVNGGDIGIHKEQQIAQMLSEGTISKATLMIGDRSVDLRAANANGISSAGVLWGYGTRDELEQEKSVHLFKAAKDWAILKGLTKRLQPDADKPRR